MCGCFLMLASGCALQEVRSKTKLGPEYRHNGSTRTDAVRWTAQQGIEFKWDKGWNTGITYRRRDTNNGGGGNDNGVWIDFSFPIWKAGTTSRASNGRIEALERRIAMLEEMQDRAVAIASTVENSTEGNVDTE